MIHLLPAQRERNRDMMPPQLSFLGLVELFEICRAAGPSSWKLRWEPISRYSF